MAPPPPKRLLTKDDAPGAPEWLDRLLGPLNAFVGPTATALAQNLTFWENFAGEVRTVDILCPDDWVPLTYANSWTRNVAYVAPAYRQLLDGQVVVRGVLERSGVPGVGTPVATGLPTADGTQPVVVVTDSGLGMADVSGSALMYYAGGIVRFTLSGIRYTAADRTPPRWATPVDVKLGTPQRPFPGRPGSVQVLRATVQGNSTAPAVVTAIDAEFINLERAKDAPGVRIHRVWGLVPGVRYTLTLLVLPE